MKLVVTIWVKRGGVTLHPFCACVCVSVHVCARVCVPMRACRRLTKPSDHQSLRQTRTETTHQINIITYNFHSKARRYQHENHKLGTFGAAKSALSFCLQLVMCSPNFLIRTIKSTDLLLREPGPAGLGGTEGSTFSHLLILPHGTSPGTLAKSTGAALPVEALASHTLLLTGQV